MTTTSRSLEPIIRQRMAELGNIFVTLVEAGLAVPGQQFCSRVEDSFKLQGKHKCLTLPPLRGSALSAEGNFRTLVTHPRSANTVNVWELPRPRFAPWQALEAILGDHFTKSLSDAALMKLMVEHAKVISFEQFWVAQFKIREKIRPHQDRRIMGLIEAGGSLLLVSVTEKRTEEKAGKEDSLHYELVPYHLRDTVENTLADYLVLPPFLKFEQ